MTHDDPNIFSSPNVADILEDFEGAKQNDAPSGCSCHPDGRPPVCQREHAHMHCWLSFQTGRVNEMQKALMEIRAKAATLRGEQAYREFPLYVANRTKEAMQIKGRDTDHSQPPLKDAVKEKAQ